MTDDSESERSPAAEPTDAPTDTPPAQDTASTPPGDAAAPEYAARHSHRKSADDPSEAGSWRARRRAKRAARKAGPRRKAPWWELPALVVLAILIAIGVKTWVIQPFYIPSQSMEQTLHGCPGCHGDRILVNKVIYDFRDPHPGDIVVFNAPPGWDDEPKTTPPSNPVLRAIRGFGQLIGFVPPDGEVLVKRVIAVGGETVKGDSDDHIMVSDHGVNGPYRTLDESSFVYIDPGQQGNIRPFGPVTVPKGRLWVMGDHRNDSADSRYHCGQAGNDTPSDSDCDPQTSTVPIGNVIGKAFVIAWPPSRWRTLGTPTTFEHGAAAAASAAAAPSAVSLVTVVPLYLMRRRKRRKRCRRAADVPAEDG